MIFENITMFNNELQRDLVIETAKKVGIYEKILSFENGIDTIVGEKVFSLSGGENRKLLSAGLF